MPSLTSQIFTVLKEANRLDLYEKVSEAWEKNSLLREENDSLKEKLRTLEQAQDLDSRLHRDDQKGWLTLEDDMDTTAKYCTFCWDDTKKLIRLRPEYREGECKKCHSKYGDRIRSQIST